ncbi:MAG: tRNA (adenine-N1)-methyltransferase [Actinobacteria bacterium]|nr:tRNA (adenine-N1)-methyltransferase [Actinomycetota bacterium]
MPDNSQHPRSLATGPLREGDRVQLTDEKGKMYSFTLIKGGQWHSHKGWINHDSIIGLSEGSLVTSNSGTNYQVMRPLFHDYLLSMPRGATIIYPKDSGSILIYADIFPGATVLEAGAGSGGLSIALLRAIGNQGRLVSYEERPEFLSIAQRNVKDYFGYLPEQWQLRMGRVQETPEKESFDRVIFDMLAPWDCLDIASKVLRPGGVLCCYVATTTQLSRTAEAIKESELFSEPESFETMLRGWHHEGLAVRPQHSMNAHTGFLLFTRRLAAENKPLRRRRRPAKGVTSEES